MVSVSMLTSPSGKSFITSKYETGELDLQDPECFVFNKAIKKYGFERFDVTTLWDDDECDDDYLAIVEDEAIESYNPEYNMSPF